MGKNLLRLFLKREDCYLVLIFFLMALAIFSKSFFNIDGYLSPDCTEYLGLAQDLLNRFSFFVHPSPTVMAGKERVLFSQWPIGYPLCIYLVAKVLGISVFWAGKLLNVIFVGLSLLILRLLFKKNAYVYGLIFFMATFVILFTFLASELPFILGLLWFSAAFYYFTQNPSSKIPLLNMILAGCFAFLNRYIGAFIPLFLFLPSLYYFVRKEYKKSFTLLFISSVLFIFATVYFYINYSQTGYIVGIRRMPALETNYQLFKDLLKTIIIELNLIRNPSGPLGFIGMLKFFSWFAFQTGLFLYLFLKIKKQLKIKIINENKSYLWFIFFSLGLTYSFYVILTRWFTHFDPFNYRLFAPATFLFLAAFISYMEFNHSQQVFKQVKVFFLIIGIVSYLLNAPLITIKTYLQRPKNNRTYYDTIKRLNTLYSQIPLNSVVVYANKHMAYLRPDLIRIMPFDLRFGYYPRRKETMHEFLDRVNRLFPHKKIYFQIKGDETLKTKGNKDKLHKTVIEFINNHQGKEFVQIK